MRRFAPSTALMSKEKLVPVVTPGTGMTVRKPGLVLELPRRSRSVSHLRGMPNREPNTWSFHPPVFRLLRLWAELETLTGPDVDYESGLTILRGAAVSFLNDC